MQNGILDDILEEKKGYSVETKKIWVNYEPQLSVLSSQSFCKSKAVQKKSINLEQEKNQMSKHFWICTL